ncbi:peroxiredoxin [Archangium violaceum]|uniref:peroxiredoxin n=1 Tax=Archangium violaceum TaxID=83451 RepID=UPI001951A149|nr:peroxiredoxin [Archangium violaceum]QRN99106.1 peroxiredoxin [Archangium violaceum]
MLIPMLVAGLLVGATPQVGEVAPEFTVEDTTGKTYTLSQMVKNGPVILAFFPKAFTSGCTRELTAYRERYADIEKLSGQVLAVSMDDKETLTKFKESLKAPFAFIPDPEGKLASLYDVKTSDEARMPGMKFANRFTFVIGEDGKVLKVESGKDAIDPTEAIASCPLRKKADTAKGSDAKQAQPQKK